MLEVRMDDVDDKDVDDDDVCEESDDDRTRTRSGRELEGREQTIKVDDNIHRLRELRIAARSED